MLRIRKIGQFMPIPKPIQIANEKKMSRDPAQ